MLLYSKGNTSIKFPLTKASGDILIDIKELQSISANTDDVILTRHVQERVMEREVSKDDLFNVISTGEIIEQYPNDFPYPSCLILGYDVNGSPLHIVVGLGKNKLWLVTVYIPYSDEWEEDLKTRKG